ncbi:hypothetical protein L1987_84659 [Smallanthus sonchifolius]|uniref:Uncharacterized protein n=1 Tax=Smallanthus sonchifolius TaxID=185202 RepID=A0ACB8XUC5_9ASTR|nr:hypothetical protein L1987_84659 [Smallanthus sonchifolius]
MSDNQYGVSILTKLTEHRESKFNFHIFILYYYIPLSTTEHRCCTVITCTHGLLSCTQTVTTMGNQLSFIF